MILLQNKITALEEKDIKTLVKGKKNWNIVQSLEAELADTKA